MKNFFKILFLLLLLAPEIAGAGVSYTSSTPPTNSVTSSSIVNGTVTKQDMNTTTPGSAVVTQIVAGAGISLTETGADTGTGIVTVTNTGGGGAVFVKDTSDNGSIAGAINGVNPTFTLSNTPAAGSLWLWVRGLFQTEGLHYTIAGDTITFFDPPDNNVTFGVDIIDAMYKL